MGGSQEWPHVDGIEEQQTWRPEQLWLVASNKQTKRGLPCVDGQNNEGRKGQLAEQSSSFFIFVFFPWLTHRIERDGSKFYVRPTFN